MSKEKSIYEQLKSIHDFQQELNVEKNMLIEKGLSSPSSPQDVIFATKLLKERDREVKSFLLDPLNTSNAGGYRSRAYLDVSYGTLRSMAKQTGLVSSIITTRKEQVASYSGYSTEPIKPGWRIEKAIDDYFGDAEEYAKAKELDFKEKEEVKELISFIENCGKKKRIYHGDDFDSFLRKFVDDSLTLDQACFEIVPSQFCKPYEFFMIDGATVRFASPELEEESDKIRGYYPYAVQLYQNSIYTSYYPWELCIGIRNPVTNIIYNGYGVSELELLVKIVTYILYSESYTGKFFSQGSNPKGVFIAKSNLSEDKLQEFRQTWTAQVNGLTGAHKIPIIGGELEWIDMQKTNTDMEFSNWLEYLSRLTCAIFKIDPSELGYNFSGENNVNYDSSVQEKLIYSKEKGLVPLLRFIEKQINKYIVTPYSNGKYRFKFTGIDNSDSLIENLDLQKVEKGVMSFGEYRAKHNLPTQIEEDDFLLNSNWIQFKQMQQGGQEQGQNFIQGMNDESIQHKDSPSVFSEFTNDNPFIRDLDKFAVEKGFM